MEKLNLHFKEWIPFWKNTENLPSLYIDDVSD
jgi:hypothetical protein